MLLCLSVLPFILFALVEGSELCQQLATNCQILQSLKEIQPNNFTTKALNITVFVDLELYVQPSVYETNEYNIVSP